MDEDLHSLGCVGCALSHFNVWKMQLERGWQRVMIFEDDPLFKARFDAQAQAVMQELQSADADWEVLSLGHTTIKDSRQNLVHDPGTREMCTTLRRGTTMFHGLAAYCVTLSGARKLVQSFLPMDVQVDAYVGLLAHPQKRDRLNLYFAEPAAVRQDPLAGSQISALTTLQRPNWKFAFPEDERRQNLLFAAFAALLLLAYVLGLAAGLSARRKTRHSGTRFAP